MAWCLASHGDWVWVMRIEKMVWVGDEDMRFYSFPTFGFFCNGFGLCGGTHKINKKKAKKGFLVFPVTPGPLGSSVLVRSNRKANCAHNSSLPTAPPSAAAAVGACDALRRSAHARLCETAAAVSSDALGEAATTAERMEAAPWLSLASKLPGSSPRMPHGGV